MEDYKKRIAAILAETGALFFGQNLTLKDGRPTPYFVNMGMFRTGRLSMEIGSFFADMMADKGILKEADIILGPSYKGSALALSTAIALYTRYGLDILFEYDRKEAKTHGEGSGSANMFVNGTFFEGCRVFIVDDVATSMGTKIDLLQRIRFEAANRNIAICVIGIGIAIDREQTTAVYDSRGDVILNRKGESAIQNFISRTGIPVFSVAGIREIVEYLYKEGVPLSINGKKGPMDALTKDQFDKYLQTYGISVHP